MKLPVNSLIHKAKKLVIENLRIGTWTLTIQARSAH